MGSWNFTYDTLNRLVSGTATAGNFNGQYACWSYDSFGNRTSESLSTTACNNNPPLLSWATYNVSNSNRMDATSLNANQSSGYDPAGDVTNDGVNTYLYDAEGRVCAVTSEPIPGMPTMTGYLYDADGNRVAKGTITSMSCDPGSNGFQLAESYVLDTSGEELTMLDGNSNWQRTNVFGAGKLLATYDVIAQVPALHFQITDPLGTRRLQTSAVGQPETDIQSLPFGDQLTIYPDPDAPTTADDATPLHYTGKERDAESGNDYFLNRYYASSMGRFLTPDFQDDDTDPEPVPWAVYDNPQSLNLYSYVYNNPLSHGDRDGHSVNVCTTGSDGSQQCTLMSNDQYQAAQQANNGGLNVPSLNQVGGNSNANGTFNATGITDASGNTVGSATYVPDNPGIDPFVPANAAGYGVIGQARTAVNIMGGIGLAAASVAMPELLSDAVPEVGGMAGLGRAGASLANKLNHIFGKAGHNLDGVVEACGGRMQAYEAMQNAASAATQGTSGPFQVTVQVGGENVVVRGTVTDGLVKIGTAFKP